MRSLWKPERLENFHPDLPSGVRPSPGARAWRPLPRGEGEVQQHAMIPLRDTLQTTSFPIVTRTLVALNLAVFALQLASGRFAETLVNIFGFIPLRFLEPGKFGYNVAEASVTLFTSIFFHGGFVHLIGNMLYLWIFGDDVEEAMGRGRFMAFYLACGAVGSLTHMFLYPAATIPSIGASGSIAGILGAFFVFYRKARIVTLLPLIVYWTLAEMPAALFLPIWFGMQFFNGFLSLASTRGVQEVAGVAWWAHVGGFLFGVFAAFVLRDSAHVREKTYQDSRKSPR